MYTRLMLASKMLPRKWYDWNLGYLLQKLDANKIIQNLTKYSENFFHSEGIAWALGLIGNDDVTIITFLQKQCKRCEDYDVWWCAAHSLEQLNQGDAIDILKRTLFQKEWQDLKYCLKHLGTRAATIGLLRMINQSNIEHIVNVCLEALNKLKGKRLHNVIWLLERLRVRDTKMVDALITFHNSSARSGSSIAHRVVEALGTIAHPKSRKILENDLFKADYFRTRALAAKGLGLIGDYKSIDKLESALQKEANPHVISMISHALYEIKDPERRAKIGIATKSNWLENGMIIDESNKWYWSPTIYEQFSSAEDPESISFKLALSLCNPNIKNILDLGAGTGRFLDEVQAAHIAVDKMYALDNSSDMIEYLKQKYKMIPSISPLLATIDDIPLKNGSIDLVISSWGFPSKVWDEEQAKKELKEVYRVMSENGLFITIGWDEEFTDEMTEIWYKFVMEEEYYFDSLSEYRRRKRCKLKSRRNCNLQNLKDKLWVPVKFNSTSDAAFVFGHLFGYSAGVWVLENNKKEFQMFVSITMNDYNSISKILKYDSEL